MAIWPLRIDSSFFEHGAKALLLYSWCTSFMFWSRHFLRATLQVLYSRKILDYWDGHISIGFRIFTRIVPLLDLPLGQPLWIGTRSWNRLTTSSLLTLLVCIPSREGTLDALWFRLMNIKDKPFSSWKKNYICIHII